MSCNNVCRLCPNLVISSSVTFTAGTGLIINIPAGSYTDNCKYCIVVAQAIPAATTITAPVFITIGDGTELYPLNKCDCTQATACSIRTRTRYATRVETSATTGVFRLLGKVCCAPNNNLTAIDGTAPVAEA
jgi:hypothetical protein